MFPSVVHLGCVLRRDREALRTNIQRHCNEMLTRGMQEGRNTFDIVLEPSHLPQSVSISVFLSTPSGPVGGASSDDVIEARSGSIERSDGGSSSPDSSIDDESLVVRITCSNLHYQRRSNAAGRTRIPANLLRSRVADNPSRPQRAPTQISL